MDLSRLCTTEAINRKEFSCRCGFGSEQSHGNVGNTVKSGQYCSRHYVFRAYLEHNLSTNEGKLETELSQNHKNIAEGNKRSETKRPPSLYKFTNLNVAAK